jgi:hypothetical protein
MRSEGKVHTLLFDSQLDDRVRCYRLYGGQIFVFSPRAGSIALCEFAREMIEAVFDPLDPRRAQYSMSVEQYVAIVAPLKPKFIHHPRTKQLLQDLLKEVGCDMSKTYFDVPRLRMVTSDGYLTSGVGYVHHPHRDTWYSAPLCQLNWWIPIYDIDSASSLAFHPRYWSQPVRNTSSRFNYYEWNSVGRRNAAQHIKTDARQQPRAEEPIELEPQVRVVCNAGGIILFSGAQLHSTVPNTSGLTRYSIDFRTVHIDDVVSKGGAPNIDSAPTGTSLRDFMRGTDLSRVPDEVVALYDDKPPEGADLVFLPLEDRTH